MTAPLEPGALPDAAFLLDLAERAARQTLPRFRAGTGVDNKLAQGFDPVTEADRAAERAIVEAIAERFPDDAILGEEYGASGEGSRRWVIDPIDGTRSFICGVPLWATLIGLTIEGRARVGIMSQPFTGEAYVADGRSAILHHGGTQRPLRTRTGVSLSEAVLFTTDATIYDAAGTARFEALRAGAKLTRYSADAYAFALLASGQIDLCVEPPVQPYDIVALIPIIEQAGGVVTRWDGGRAEDGGPIVAAGSAALHAQALEILNG